MEICKCYKCESASIVKNGHDKNGKQKYFCKDCKSILTENVKRSLTNNQKKEIKTLIELDCSVKEISERYNKSTRTIYYLIR